MSRNFMGRPDALNIPLIGLAIFILILLIPGIGIWSVVDAGHVGVVTRSGAVDRVVNPGFTFKLPFIESVYAMETRTRKEQVEALAASKDLQQVTSTIAINFHLRGEKAVEVYQDVGGDYITRIITPAVHESFKSTTAQFTASDLIGKRQQVKQMAFIELRDRLAKYNVIVDDLNIVNFSFSQEFTAAIEQKTVAEQNREKAAIEAQTAIIQAQGQADAQKKLKDSGSLTAEYLRFLTIQKWDGKLPYATDGVPLIELPAK